MKRIAVLIIILSCFLVTSAHADSREKSRHQGYGLDTKIFHKIHLALKNQEELGISDEQYEKLKTLKANTQKDLIKRKAEIDIIGVDMKSKLKEDTIDTKSINKLIDQKYELKKAKAKALVEAYAAFQNILTDDQKKKLKDITHKSPAK
jgi:Spy/CpxP family protein refolding chaperone